MRLEWWYRSISVLVMTLALLPGCVDTNAPEDPAMTLRIVRSPAAPAALANPAADWKRIADAVRADSDIPACFWADVESGDLSAGTHIYLRVICAEVFGDSGGFIDLPSSWTCIKLAFNDDPEDDCPVRVKPEQG